MKYFNKILLIIFLLVFILIGCHPRYAVYNNYYIEDPRPIGEPIRPTDRRVIRLPIERPIEPVIVYKPVNVIEKPVEIMHSTPLRDNIGDRKYEEKNETIKDKEEKKDDSKKHPSPLRDSGLRR
ncbi:MAG: hypothetical protein JXA68_05255 [Ignavibacteriales bacterium]|nr:hypothetical protein [Ignavibacteriales bacterium]